MSVEKSARRTWGRATEGALAGAVAGLLSAAVELLVRTIIGLPSPVELLGDLGTRLIPGPIFEFLLGIFGHTAKYLYLTGILIAQVVGLGLLTALAFAVRGLVIRRRALAALADAEVQGDGDFSDDADEQESPDDSDDADDAEVDSDDENHLFNFAGAHDYTPEEQAALEATVPSIQRPVGWWFSAALAAIAWLLSGILVMPVMGAGLFGVNLPVGSGVAVLSLLAPALAFGASLPLSQQGLRWLGPRLIASPTAAARLLAQPPSLSQTGFHWRGNSGRGRAGLALHFSGPDRRQGSRRGFAGRPSAAGASRPTAYAAVRGVEVRDE